MTQTKIEPLTEQSLFAVRDLVIRAVTEEPLAFPRSPEEVAARTVDDWKQYFPPKVPLMLARFVITDWLALRD
jgi:hypothetical protein